MAVTFTIYDPDSLTTKTIQAEVEASYVQGDEDAVLDFYIKLSTTAKNGDGDSIPNNFIRNLSDLADDTVMHNGNPGPYATLKDAIEDYVLHMVEGDAPGEEMAF